MKKLIVIAYANSIAQCTIYNVVSVCFSDQRNN
jgi:hypothetical protein